MIKEARTAIESNSVEQMNAALEKLQNDKTLQEAVAQMYAEAQAGAASESGAPEAGAAGSSAAPEATPGPGSDGNANDDSVVDADFEMVDDEKDK